MENGSIINNYFYGDSLIERWDLKYYFPIAEIVNIGESGATINDVTSILSNPQNNNDICFVLIGTNDCIKKSQSGYSEENIFNEFIFDYENLLNNLSMRINKIYIISLLPIAPSYDNQNYLKTLYPKINSWLEKRISLDPKLKFINVYTKFTNSNNYISDTYSQDGLHLNALGYSLLSSTIREYVE
jgi:lysophospholipase L1-like esterase